MDKVFVNTHHAYLNTKIVFKSNRNGVVIKDRLTGLSYTLLGEVSVYLCAGTHKFYGDDICEDIIVVIEDAVKYGGGKLRNAFVFDNNPWLFVITSDRMYATNLDTLEERVEYNLSPDSIVAFDTYYQETCDFFLLNTGKDYSIYNVVTGEQVIIFSQYIYGNSHLIIYKEGDTIIVFNYRKRKIIAKVSEQYSFGKKFFFVKNGYLWGLNLTTDYINKIDFVGPIDEHTTLSGDYLLKMCSDNSRTKLYKLFYLGNGENFFEETTLRLPYYIDSFCNMKTNEFPKLVEKVDKVIEDHNYLKYQICCHALAINKIEYTYENSTKMLVISGKLVSSPAIFSQDINISFSFKGVSTGHIGFDNVEYKIQNEEEGTELTAEKNVDLEIPKGGVELGCSSSNNLVVYRYNDNLYLKNIASNETSIIFEKSFDVSKYNSAYFTSDGKNVIVSMLDNVLGVIGLDEMTLTPFVMEGSTVSRHVSCNGYNPEIIFHNIDGRKPVWRDPITLKRIDDSDISNYIFKSPYGDYSASTQMKIVLYSRILRREITEEDVIELQNKYNWDTSSSEKKRELIIENRKELRKTMGDEELFKPIYEYTQKISSENNAGRTRLNAYMINDYMNIKPDFLPLIVEELGYVIVNNENKKEDQLILIGRNVWFLNYVSFSYDSRYIAFCAKMKKDTWRNSEEGVFEIYDIKAKKIVVRRDKENDLYAVWMSMFSNDGNVAYYDSHANTFLVKAEQDYQHTEIAPGKSLLCFSPSGQYIALSNQNYIDFTNHPNIEWGHQPSGNIFIHKVENFDKCVEHYNDFGEGIYGTSPKTRKAGNVAAAAFSSDEKRLLAVGDDGVLVIRNLHLDI